MHLDRAGKELGVKIVYAGEGAAALAEVDALAAQAKPGTASPVLARLGDAVHTFELRMPLQVRGCALHLKIVGVALDQLAADADKSLFIADAGVAVAGPDARATFDRVRALLGAAPLALVAPAALDGLDGVPTAPNGRLALQGLLKQLMPELTKKVDEAP